MDLKPIGFDIFTKREWGYASISFVIGIIALYNYATFESIPIYIMFPIILTGTIFLVLFFRSIATEDERQSLESVRQ